MNKSEFVLLIPALIYGVALVDLLKIFRHKIKYWETVGWGIAMFLNLIVSWFNLFDKLDIISSNILYFTGYLLSPLLFTQAVFVLTPEEEDKIPKDYFLKTQKQFFTILLAFILTNTFLSFYIDEEDYFLWIRLILIVPFIATIVWPKVWLRTLLLIFYYLIALLIFFDAF